MLRALIRAAGLLALVGAFSSALAVPLSTQSATVLTKTGTNVVTATAGSPSLLTQLLNQPRQTAITAGTDGAALLRDLLNGPGPRSQVPVGVTRTLPWAKMSKAIVRSLPGIATAVAVVELLEAVRCQEGFGGGPECDLGQPEETTEGKVYTACGTYTSGSAVAAAQACQDATDVSASNVYDSWCENHTFTSVPNGSVTGTNPLNVGFTRTQTVSMKNGCGYTATYTSVVTIPVAVATVVQTACPAITVNGQQFVPSKDIDDKCPTGIYEPVANEVAEDRLNTIPSRAPAVAIAGELIARGIDVEHSAPGFDIESAPQAERQITTTPDGDRTVVDKSWPWTIRNDGYGWSERIRTETYPPGATIPPLDPEAGGGTVVEGPGSGSGVGEEIITCGLPKTPPCKIDEGGTPPPVDPTAFDPVDDPIDPLRALITDPQIPEIEWSWAFSLPSSCSVIALGDFGGRQVSFDLCTYQPMIHDLVTMFWAGVGVLAAWGLLARTFGGAS